MVDLPPPHWPSADEPSDDDEPADAGVPTFSESISAPVASGGSGSSSTSTSGQGRAVALAAGALVVFFGIGAVALFVVFSAPFNLLSAGDTVEVELGGGGEMAGGGPSDPGLPRDVEQRATGPAAPGSTLRGGAAVQGVVDGLPVAHPLVLAEGRSVDLHVVEADFDTVLVVLDEAGQVVAGNDDGGEDLLSRVRTVLTAGDYEVRVAGFSSTERGSYELRLD